MSSLLLILAILETVVVGTVRSASTGEPIANANLSIRGTKIGTATAEDGSYYLHLAMGEKGKLRVSAIGYAPTTVEIRPGEMEVQDIILIERAEQLQEVFAYPGANPALAILDSVRRHRPAAHEREQVSVATDEHLSPFLTHRHLDLYAPTMPFGTISFLSPLAQSGPAFYEYRLQIQDEEEAESDTCVIRYRPRNSVDPLLQGELVISRKSWRLIEATAGVPYRANINYLKRMDYRAEYDEGRMTRDTMETEWQLTAWRDTVHQTPAWLMRTAEWLSYTVHTGYIRTGSWLDIGQVDEMIGYTRHEGLHIGMGARTNERLMKRVSLQGSIGYGFGDRRVKYRAGLTALLPTQRRHALSVELSDRYRYTEESNFSRLPYENSAFERPITEHVMQEMAGVQRNERTTARRVKQIEVGWQADWRPGEGSRPALETHTRLQLREVERPRSAQADDSPIRHIALSTVYRLSWGEQTLDLYTLRKHLYGRYPTLFIGHEVGEWRTEQHESTLYARLHVTAMQTLRLGVGGSLTYAISGGITLGDQPRELQEQVQANYAWTYDPYRLSLLRQGTHHTKRWCSLHAHWNGGGVLFNRIPYVRYAHLREVAEIQAAWADCLSVPYVEAGVGIGNILGIGECLFVARLTRSVEDTPWMGFRFRIHTSL